MSKREATYPHMSSETSCSAPSVSVSYGTLDIGLYAQKGRDIQYASLDRASDVVAQLPASARRTLLAPIEQRLIDPQSVFYLIDDKSGDQIAICVEDFRHLASTNYNTDAADKLQENGEVYLQNSGCQNSGAQNSGFKTAVCKTEISS